MKPSALCKSKHVHVLSKTCLHQALFCDSFSTDSQISIYVYLPKTDTWQQVNSKPTLTQGGGGGWVCEGLQKVDSR